MPASLQSVMCCADDAAKDSGVNASKPPLNVAFACIWLAVESTLHSPVFFLCKFRYSNWKRVNDFVFSIDSLQDNSFVACSHSKPIQEIG